MPPPRTFISYPFTPELTPIKQVIFFIKICFQFVMQHTEWQMETVMEILSGELNITSGSISFSILTILKIPELCTVVLVCSPSRKEMLEVQEFKTNWTTK